MDRWRCGKRVNNVAGTIGVFRDIVTRVLCRLFTIILIGTEEQANHTFDVRLKERLMKFKTLE